MKSFTMAKMGGPCPRICPAVNCFYGIHRSLDGAPLKGSAWRYRFSRNYVTIQTTACILYSTNRGEAGNLDSEASNHILNELDLDEVADPEPSHPPSRKRTRTKQKHERRFDSLSIKARLDGDVMGQEIAKRQLSVLFSIHANRRGKDSNYVRTPNAILVGPTGVGKTLTLKVAAEYLGVPFISVDTTTLVPSGANGYQVGDIINELLSQAKIILGYDPDNPHLPDKAESEARRLAEQGVIFFDEIDKIRVVEDGTESQNKQWMRLVQRALLKVTEGAPVQCGVARNYNDNRSRPINTAGILVMAGGAFAGITDSIIVNQRPEALKRAFSRRSNNGTASTDIVSYGFLPELVARLPILIDFVKLTDADLLKILEHEKNSPYLVWKEHFQLSGKKLLFAHDVNGFLIERAKLLEMGARGLHQALFPGMAELAFGIESTLNSDVTICADELIKVLGY